MIDHVLNGHGTIAYSVCDKMPWYSKDSEAAFDPQEAERLLDEAGWKTGADGIREKDGKKAGFTMLYRRRSSVRQALFRGYGQPAGSVWDPCDCGRRGLGYGLMTGPSRSL